MKRRRYIKVGSSDYKKYREELQAAHEELQRLESEGWQIESATHKSHKRPRIQKEKTPRLVVISVMGGKLRITYSEYIDHCKNFTVIEFIY